MVILFKNFMDLKVNLFIILTDLLTKFVDLINSNLWIILSCEILIISLTVLMANRINRKIIKGLGAAILIGRTVYAEYKIWKGQGTSGGINKDTDETLESDLKYQMTRSTYKQKKK